MSGVSWAFLRASAKRLLKRSSLFFSASTDCLKMLSLRSSCSRRWRVAWSKSSKVRLRGAGVCATMARVELEAYRSAVTDWELRRYFERI